MPGIVRALFVKPEKGATLIPLASVDATPTGFGGDYHSRRMARRQILLISGNVLKELAVDPGAIDENVVVDDLDVMSLTEGQQLRLGDALVAVTTPCEPCDHTNRIRHGLKEALKGRRGMFVRVVAPGAVRVGDPVVLVDQESPAEHSPG